MMGATFGIWRSIVERHYPKRGLGTSPPYTRAYLMYCASHRMPATREYYATIDNLTTPSHYPIPPLPTGNQ